MIKGGITCGSAINAGAQGLLFNCSAFGFNDLSLLIAAEGVLEFDQAWCGVKHKTISNAFNGFVDLFLDRY
ncbi:hypothetical protein JCM30760_07020 [Thiomicrorhabdus hydrogeniphila]